MKKMTMPFNPERARGQVFSTAEILEDLNIKNPRDARVAVLDRCKLLYSSAEQKGDLNNFGTPHTFVVCESSQFFSTLVNMGYGNSALVIIDDFSPDVYFLLFSDKVPEKYRPIVAVHEAIEYQLMLAGTEQSEAHQLATQKEIEHAATLNLLQEYLDFLGQNYPLKLENIQGLY